MADKTRVAAIVGPTAAGKTELAVEVAELLGAEIVSIDSMQAYRHMDAGTAKPSQDQRTRVPHHLIDVFEPSHEVSVAEFQALAREAIDDIATRGRLPLLVGGSGLYFRAVVDDLVFPPRSDEIRSSLEDEADELGPEVLHERLREADPAAAARMEPTNTRRIIRALEVIELTGRKFSDNVSWETYESRYDLRVAGLRLPRTELYQRISDRAAAMLGAGLVREALDLGDDGLSRTAGQALGYRQVLDAPIGTPEQTIHEAIVRATKRFARRQESWFKSDPRVRWFDAPSADVVSAWLSGRAGRVIDLTDSEAVVPDGT